MLMGAGIVVPAGGPGCWLFGPVWDTALGNWGATVKPGAAAAPGASIAEEVTEPGWALAWVPRDADAGKGTT